MTSEEILGVTVLNSWRLVISRFNKTLSELSDEQLQQQAAPGRNRVFYLLGHLTAMHDRMFPLLALRRDFTLTWTSRISRIRTACLPILSQQPNLGEHGQRSMTNLLGLSKGFHIGDWLQKHAAVSDDDVIKDPMRNRLAVGLLPILTEK